MCRLATALMRWLNDFAPAIQALAAVFIAALTVAVWKATKRYVEVSEALQKPSITVKSEPRDLDAVVEAPYLTQAAQEAGHVVILNVGTGPALDLRYGFRQVNVPPGGAAIHLPGFVNYLQPGQQSQVPLARTSLANREFDFNAQYKSLSGRKYEAKVRLENGVIKSS